MLCCRAHWRGFILWLVFSRVENRRMDGAMKMSVLSCFMLAVGMAVFVSNWLNAESFTEWLIFSALSMGLIVWAVN